MRCDFGGDILSVRSIEDCIRATKKYTKGAFSRPNQITESVQGAEFPSKTVTEYYEVYPDLEVSWEMPASSAWAWVWGDVTHIDVRFTYDYRYNRARMIVYGGSKSLQELSRGIPGFGSSLKQITRNRQEQHDRNGCTGEEVEPVVDSDNRLRTSPVSHTQ